MTEIDPITLAVVNGTLKSVTREMGITIDRTARSPVLKLARDYSNGVLDADTNQLMQGEDIPVHLGALQYSARSVADYFEGEIYPGDVMYHNSPATGATHKQDCCAIRPIFYGDELLFWVCCNAHLSDIGGGVAGGYNPLATDLYAEGLRISPIKLVERGGLRRDVFDLIVGSVRTSAHTRGDIRAQIGAVDLAERRLVALAERYGAQTIRGCVTALLDGAEKRMRAEVERMADGTYQGQSWVEDDGHGSGPSRLDCEVTIRGGTMRIGMSSRPQLPSYFNCYYSVTASAILLGVVTYIDPEIPHNAGAYRAIEMDFGPPGTMLNAVEPAACSMATTTPFDSIVEAVRDALSKVVPERSVAGSSHMCFSIWAAQDPRNEEVYVFSAVPGLMGGGGASWGLDGWNCIGTVATGGAMLTGDIELTEHEYPVHTHFYELEPDSACPGRWRGGFGGRYAIEPVGHTTQLSSIGEGVAIPPPSLGNADSNFNPDRVYRRWVVRVDGHREDLISHALVELKPGDIYHSYPPGGGGVGDPCTRDIELVRADVENGLVTRERAAEEYGVVFVGDTLNIDGEATAVRRSGAVDDGA